MFIPVEDNGGEMVFDEYLCGEWVLVRSRHCPVRLVLTGFVCPGRVVPQS